MDASKTAPFDTFFVQTYQYDNAKRLTDIIQLNYNFMGHYDMLNKVNIHTTLSYDGNDTLPAKAVAVFQSLGTEEFVITHFYKYFAGTGTLSYDSVTDQITKPTTGSIQSRVNNYTKNSETSYSQLITGTNLFPETVKYTLVKQNGNIVSEKVEYDNGDIANLTFTYDNFHSAFYNGATSENGNPGFVFEQSLASTLHFPFLNGQKNNITTRLLVHTFSGIPPSTQSSQGTYTYKYNENGYPKEILMNDPDFNYNKYVLMYTK